MKDPELNRKVRIILRSQQRRSAIVIQHHEITYLTQLEATFAAQQFKTDSQKAVLLEHKKWLAFIKRAVLRQEP